MYNNNDNNDTNNINLYVITLKTKDEYIKSDNYNSLKTITNKIKLTKGIILNKEQSNKYKYYSKSGIGIILAHMNTWKYIYKRRKKYNNKYAIIFEDDTFINTSILNYHRDIKNIINNKKFDIYKLHSDFDDGSTSMASYIINIKSIPKIFHNFNLIFGQIDSDLFISYKLGNIIQLCHNYNIFRTNENSSSNRDNKYNFLNMLDFKIYKRNDKKLKDFLSYKIYRINNYEIIAYEIILLFFLLLSIIFRNKYIFLIIIILFIL